MSVSYKKLWKLLIDKDMNKTDLRLATGLSSATIARMTRSDSVSMEVLMRICSTLECDVGDIMELRSDDACSDSAAASWPKKDGAK